MAALATAQVVHGYSGNRLRTYGGTAGRGDCRGGERDDLESR